MIYFDNAATTFPKPQTVLKSVINGIRIYGGNAGRSGHQLSLRTSQKIYEVRSKLGDFFHVSPEQVIFTSNCTQALNMAIKGVMLDGGHIILSNLEHNSVIRPIHTLAEKRLIEYDVATVYEGDTERTLRSFASYLRRDTRAIVCTHASNVTGTILPIAELGQLCRQQGILLIVDAAQTAGVLPLDLPKMNIDILCTAGHKGLYGITGTGLMVLNTDCRLSTLMEGGTGSLSNELSQPDFLPDRYESGTINTVGILSLEGGLAHINRLGLPRIYQYEWELCRTLYQGVQEYDRVKICTPFETLGDRAPIFLFNIKGLSSTEVVEQLSRRGFCLRGGLQCSPLAHDSLGTNPDGAVRFSPSVFNRKQEVFALIREIRQMSR